MQARSENNINYNMGHDRSIKPMETILIVEDEMDLAEIATAHLEDVGYSTIHAISAEEALDILEHNHEIDLVFSDIVLPGGIGGFRLVQSINAMNSELKLLLTSAYFEKPLEVPGNSIITDLTKTLLKKPYSRVQLIDAVKRALKKK